MPKSKSSTTATSDQRGLAEGYRSGLEEKIAAQLAQAGLQVRYEDSKVYYTPPLKQRSYLADFVLPNGIIIETKGRFMTADRQKHKVIKDEHPDLDIRFVFSRSRTRISKASRTTYADWCLKYGFQWADATVPQAWIAEPPKRARIEAIKKAAQK